MQNQIEQPSLYEQIKTNYNEEIIIIQEIKEQQREDQNEREQ